jgi:hypothetical protein
MINPLLLRRIPDDVIINHIMPYAYNVQDKRHLYDIRNFYTDYKLIDVMFNYNNNNNNNNLKCVLMDLLRFCHDHSYANILDRHFMKTPSPSTFGNRGYGSLQNQNRWVTYYKNIRAENIKRGVKYLFALLTPIERNRFYNTYYIGID